MGLYDELTRIAQQVESQLSVMQSVEAATINASVMPLVRALGYSTHDLNEVFPEYAVLDNTAAVDLAILRNSKPIIFIEAKRAREKLGHKHWKQLLQYFNNSDVSFGILTNGLEYRFYADFDKPNVMDTQPFLTVDLLNLDERTVKVLDGFTKTRFDPIKSVRYLKLREKVGRELEQPSDWLVKHFIWDIHTGPRWQSVIEEYRPLLKRAIQEYLEDAFTQNSDQPDGSVNVPPKPVIDKRNGPQRPTHTDPDFIPIFGYYNEHRFEAELRLESVRKGIFIGSKSIRYKGDLMKASHAMWNAIRDVFPEFDSDTWNSQNLNSWEFWHVVDPLDGSERILRLIAGWKGNRDHDLYDRIVSL